MSAIKKQSVLIYCLFFLFIGVVMWASVHFIRDFQWQTYILPHPSLFNIPLIVYICACVLLMALLVNAIFSYSYKKLIDDISDMLIDLERGNLGEGRHTSSNADISEIKSMMDKVEGRLKDQAQRSQKIMTEWAEREKALEEKMLAKERSRLARELHDSVSQQLYAASMLLSALMNQKWRLPEEVQKRCQQVESVIVEAQNDMRALLLQLRPFQLENKTFKQGIQDLVSGIENKHQLRFQLNIHNVTMPAGVEDQLFRIAQEAIANTIRHAQASEIELYLDRIDHFILLKITDDGRGFSVPEQKTSGYGLKGISERSEEVGGTSRVVSVPGEGTSIEIKVPIVFKEEENSDDSSVDHR